MSSNRASRPDRLKLVGAAYCYLISSLRSEVTVTAGAALSVTVNLNVVFGMAADGVPLMVPVVASNVSPVGNAGVTDHFSGGVKLVVSKAVDG